MTGPSLLSNVRPIDGPLPTPVPPRIGGDSKNGLLLPPIIGRRLPPMDVVDPPKLLVLDIGGGIIIDGSNCGEGR